jgi:hypothetical protein
MRKTVDWKTAMLYTAAVGALFFAASCYGEEFDTEIPDSRRFTALQDPTVFVMSNGVQIAVKDPGGVCSVLTRRKDSNAVRRPFTVLWLKSGEVAVRVTDYKCDKGQICVSGEKLSGALFTVERGLDVVKSKGDELPSLKMQPMIRPLGAEASD